MHFPGFEVKEPRINPTWQDKQKSEGEHVRHSLGHVEALGSKMQVFPFKE